MSAIVLLLEARDAEVDRVLAALAEGGLSGRVQRLSTRADLALALGLGADVVDAAQRRDHEDAVRRRDDFLARAAHQLRTPLNAVLGWASLLGSRRLDEAGRARALATIERNARAGARMIEDLIDVSRMMTGAIPLDVSAVEICPVAAGAIESMRGFAESAGVALCAELDEEAGAILGDPRRVEQVLRELIGNAIRATPRGGRVTLHLVRRDENVVVSIHDTGRGIAPERLPQLFDGLGRRDRPASHGLGVGLWLVAHLMDAHGGSVEATSPGEGGGATFTLRFPARSA